MKRTLLLVSLLVACSDPVDSDPCGFDLTCLSPGVDLEVTNVTLMSPIGTNATTGFAVVDSVNVSYTVRNNGTLASQPAPANFSGHPATYALAFDTVPALQPGQSITRMVRMNTIREFFEATDDDRFRLWVALNAPSETGAARENNVRETATYHFAVPKLEVIVGQFSVSQIRVNDPVRVSVTLTNTSAIAAKNIRIRHCLRNYNVMCVPGYWTTFGDLPLADLAPGESRTLDYTTSVPPTARFEGYPKYDFEVCISSREDTGAYFDLYAHAGLTICGSAGVVDVWPDYEACNPPVLGAAPVTLSAPNCGFYPAPPAIPANTFRADWYRQHLSYVFALDVVAGESYTIVGHASPVFYDDKGVEAADQNSRNQQVSFLNSGRYYLKIRAEEGVKTISVQ